jgi:hypothetical protein
MVAGFERGMQYMHEHPKESIEVLRKKMPDEDGSTLEEAYALMIKWTPRKSEVSDEAWAKTQALGLEAGMIKPEEKLSSFKELYVSEFAK